MSRETWVYPSNGGEPYLKGSRPDSEPVSKGYMIMGDLPDFVSPIDRKLYSGRAGMREHNQRHNVVPHADLVGLPYRTANLPPTLSKEQKAARKEQIIHQVNKHWKS